MDTYPRQKESPVLSLPIQSEGPADFFPPVCLQSHWDPTMILKRTLPSGYVPQPTDPRPWTRICLEYTTAGDQEPAAPVNPNVVLPSGGQFYPPTRYSSAIDSESALRRLDRPLGTSDQKQYLPNPEGDMFNARVLVPNRAHPVDPTRIQELAYPQALLRSGPYKCREEQDRLNTQLTAEFSFNKATKQDRYKLMGKSNRPAPPQEVLKAVSEAPLGRKADLPFDAFVASPAVAPAVGAANK